MSKTIEVPAVDPRGELWLQGKISTERYLEESKSKAASAVARDRAREEHRSAKPTR